MSDKSAGLRRALWMASVALLVVACAENVPYDSLDPVGPAARQVDALFRPVFWIAVAIFVLVQGVLLAAVILFRDREGRPLPRQIHGNTLLEILWTAIPAVILAGVGFFTVKAIFDVRAEATGALQVTVTGHQWWWEIEYPDEGVVTANELRIPVGRQIFLRLEASDVIHSFWVPRLAGTQDMVPGRTHTLAIEAPEPGEYWGQCKEFCGLSHAIMRFRVVAQPEEEFRAWLEQQRQPATEPADDLARQGRELFATGACASCHVVRGVTEPQNPVGPDLTHFASRGTMVAALMENTPENLATWLRDPPEVKPGSKMPNLQLGPDEIRALVAYLESLE